MSSFSETFSGSATGDGSFSPSNVTGTFSANVVEDANGSFTSGTWSFTGTYFDNGVYAGGGSSFNPPSMSGSISLSGNLTASGGLTSSDSRLGANGFVLQQLANPNYELSGYFYFSIPYTYKLVGTTLQAIDLFNVHFDQTAPAVPRLPPIISISSGPLSISAKAGTANYTLSRGPVPIGDTGSSVVFSTHDGTAVAGKDYISTSQTVSFAAGSSTASVPVTILFNSADAAAHINPDFAVVLSSPTNASIGVGTAGTTLIEGPAAVSNVVISGIGTTSGTGVVHPGAILTFAISMNEVVTLSGSALTLTLNNGGVATYVGGSGTSTLNFIYNVLAGQNTSDLTVSAIKLNGTTVVDTIGANADLSGATLHPAGTIQIATTTAAGTTVQQEILGLYTALYNRAVDFPGYSYWVGIDGQQADSGGVTVASAGNIAVTLNDAKVLGQTFVNTQSAFFNQTYASLTDSQFVNALYVNLGGNAGDPGGIAYWSGILQQLEVGGQSVQAARAGLVGQFVHDLIGFDLSSGAAALGLTAAQYQAAATRQAAINDKIAVSLAYSNASQPTAGSILVPQTLGDAAFQASTRALAHVTSDPATVATAITGINNAVSVHDLTQIM